MPPMDICKNIQILKTVFPKSKISKEKLLLKYKKKTKKMSQKVITYYILVFQFKKMVQLFVIMRNMSKQIIIPYLVLKQTLSLTEC